MKIIGHIKNDYKEKFGIPRQSGIVTSVESRIVLEPEYRNPHVYNGIEGYSHLWLLWEFSENVGAGWSPTVLPPRLGGKTHMGVFATRSPFRPNPIGLSCVRLLRYEKAGKEGPVLHVAGADLMDGTPIYDIKPYLPYADCHPEALSGFAGTVGDYRLNVEIPEELEMVLSQEKIETIKAILAQDPRPSYQNDKNRRYGMAFGGYDIRFMVDGKNLKVCEVVRMEE